MVTKSGNLNFLEPSEPVQACNGTVLPLPLRSSQVAKIGNICLNVSFSFFPSYTTHIIVFKISIFLFVPLQLSSNKLFLRRKILKGHLLPLAPLANPLPTQVTLMSRSVYIAYIFIDLQVCVIVM